MRSEPFRISNLEARVGYDFGRQRPNSLGMLWFDLVGRERLLLGLAAHDGVRPFGNHNPYGNTILTVIGGYDARQYQREREWDALLIRHFSDERWIGAGFVRTRQDPLRPVVDFHLFGPDYWMKRNEPAEHVVENGIHLHVHRRPPYLGETILTGLVLEGDTRIYGGALLKGTSEYGRSEWDLWYTGTARRDKDTWEARFSASLATGRAPRQAWPDLGGAAGMRAFPPRGLRLSDDPNAKPVLEDQPGQLVGTQRLFLRMEYRWQEELLRHTGIPLVKKLKPDLVPFVETGSVWGNPLEDPILRFKDLRAPHSSEILWDFGIGIRRDIGYSGILTHLQLDFAWPMGSDTGPARITVLLSNNWLD